MHLKLHISPRFHLFVEIIHPSAQSCFPNIDCTIQHLPPHYSVKLNQSTLFGPSIHKSFQFRDHQQLIQTSHTIQQIRLPFLIQSMDLMNNTGS